MAEDPVASRTLLLSTFRGSGMSFTATLRMVLLPQSEHFSNVAQPVRRLTPKSFSCRTASSELDSASSVIMAPTCIQMASSWMRMLRSITTLSCLPTSRSALENKPVGPPKSGLVSASVPFDGQSMSSTRLPAYAAFSAACTPVGPPPTMVRSNWNLRSALTRPIQCGTGVRSSSSSSTTGFAYFSLLSLLPLEGKAALSSSPSSSSPSPMERMFSSV
mmetsp:Transcript_29191/g.74905  ORF Transcript_29191/g.74905 Transcript_29191/m.74905 type:complete len:218 (+) Transcript_29191:1857-2510(+)